MGAGGYEMLAAINLIPEDKGILTTIPGVGLFSVRTSGALILTAATAPTITVAAGQVLVTWAAASVAAALVSFVVPIDFERVTRTLKVHLAAKMGGATDIGTISITLYATTPAGVLKGPFTVGAAQLLTSVVAEYVVDFSDVRTAAGLEIEPGDTVYMSMVPSAHATDSIILSALRIDYSGMIAAAVFADREF